MACLDNRENCPSVLVWFLHDLTEPAQTGSIPNGPPFRVGVGSKTKIAGLLGFSDANTTRSSVINDGLFFIFIPARDSGVSDVGI